MTKLVHLYSHEEGTEIDRVSHDEMGDSCKGDYWQRRLSLDGLRGQNNAHGMRKLQELATSQMQMTLPLHTILNTNNY